MKKFSADSTTAEPVFEQTLTLARALGALVLQLRTDAGTQTTVEQRDAVRRTLRAAVAAARVTALELRLTDGHVVLGDRVLPPDSPFRDDMLDALVGGLAANGSTVLDVRRSAAPGELLALARLLVADSGAPLSGGAWRSWSVRMTPASVATIAEPVQLPDCVRHEIARLSAVRRDSDMTSVVQSLQRIVMTPPWSHDSAVIEGIALAVVSDARTRGTRGGRLALEGAIRQLLTPAVIDALVQRLPVSASRDDLMPVLARAGDLSVQSLVRLLVDADTLAERRVCFDAIVALDAGEAALCAALRDDRWYVVRNAASLLGEMGVVEADAQLVPLLSSVDERLRIAGVRALTRLGTERALIELQAMLTDTVPEIRRLAAAAHGASSQGKPSVSALLTALDDESDEDVVLEIVAVLGSLGSPDGVQRLMKLLRSEAADVTPWMREAAYNALVAARGRGVTRLLE